MTNCVKTLPQFPVTLHHKLTHIGNTIYQISERIRLREQYNNTVSWPTELRWILYRAYHMIYKIDTNWPVGVE
jgi:hypothetical protein